MPHADFSHFSLANSPHPPVRAVVTKALASSGTSLPLKCHTTIFPQHFFFEYRKMMAS